MLPRLKIPVLMVNGRYDYVFSVEKAQLPLFRMLGTPAEEKEHVALETGHDVTGKHDELVKAVLGWLDKYLGRDVNVAHLPASRKLSGGPVAAEEGPSIIPLPCR